MSNWVTIGNEIKREHSWFEILVNRALFELFVLLIIIFSYIEKVFEWIGQVFYYFHYLLYA